jgi:hypothetical protein
MSTGQVVYTNNACMNTPIFASMHTALHIVIRTLKSARTHTHPHTHLHVHILICLRAGELCEGAGDLAMLVDALEETAPQLESAAKMVATDRSRLAAASKRLKMLADKKGRENIDKVCVCVCLFV